MDRTEIFPTASNSTRRVEVFSREIFLNKMGVLCLPAGVWVPRAGRRFFFRFRAAGRSFLRPRRCGPSTSCASPAPSGGGGREGAGEKPNAHTPPKQDGMAAGQAAHGKSSSPPCAEERAASSPPATVGHRAAEGGTRHAAPLRWRVGGAVRAAATTKASGPQTPATGARAGDSEPPPQGGGRPCAPPCSSARRPRSGAEDRTSRRRRGHRRTPPGPRRRSHARRAGPWGTGVPPEPTAARGTSFPQPPRGRGCAGAARRSAGPSRHGPAPRRRGVPRAVPSGTGRAQAGARASVNAKKDRPGVHDTGTVLRRRLRVNPLQC